ncbi:hypothetical protein JCM11251_005576 [Rhodosporidiobolus azoricus]
MSDTVGDAGSIPSTGVLIWLAVKPLIRVLVVVGLGFTLQILKILPPDGTRTLALFQIRVALPCLLFAKIVPSFTHDNISALGPIILTGFFYQALPAALGLLARAVTPTPRRFRYGMIAAYAFGNWGDLPFSMVASVAASAPFNGEVDEDLGSAYVAIFILVNYISLFPLQGLKLCEWDYTRPISADLERRYEDGEFGAARRWLNRLWRGQGMKHEVEEERKRLREGQVTGEEKKEGMGKEIEQGGKEGDGPTKRSPRMITSGTQTRGEEDDIVIAPPANLPPATPDFPLLEPHPSHLTRTLSRRSASSPSSTDQPPPGPSERVLLSIWALFRPLVTSPPTVALLVALVISLVPTLRALFVLPEDSNASFQPTAPDGDPPLAILYDTADFIGGASIPIGLSVLGASMAKLKIPRPITLLPLSSVLAMAVIRLALVPIIGYFFVEQLVKSGMVARDNAVLRFVLTLLSCVPTATTQVAYTQIFAPPGTESNADLIAAYLIMQYLFWAFSNVILTAVSLNSIFS